MNKDYTILKGEYTTLTNRETLIRAVGIIEGVSWGSPDKVADALLAAVEMIDTVLNSEPAEYFAVRTEGE